MRLATFLELRSVPCTESAMSMQRDAGSSMIEVAAWAEIDLDAIRSNLRLVRRMSPGARVYVVCKGHGYGFDAGTVARLAESEKMDALACGSVEDVQRIRNAGITLPILLYATTAADQLPEIARLGVIVTAHDSASLDVCLSNDLLFSIKLDTGFSRLGFQLDAMPLLERAARSHPTARAFGIYTHLSGHDDPDLLHGQVGLFHSMTARVHSAGWSKLERMVASTRVMISHPDLVLDAVNPGRLIYGILEKPYDALVEARCALIAVKARIIALRVVKAGTRLSYSEDVLEQDTTLAVIPFGFANGYPRFPSGGKALLRGQRVNLLGPRHTEHSILDVTDVKGVGLDDEVVLMGRQGDECIDIHEISDATGVPLIELVARLASSFHKKINA